MSLFANIDTSDPCAVYPVLEKAHLELLAGSAVARGRFGEDDVQFASTDIQALERKIRELKAECAAKTTGVVTRRRAGRAGFLR